MQNVDVYVCMYVSFQINKKPKVDAAKSENKEAHD